MVGHTYDPSIRKVKCARITKYELKSTCITEEINRFAITREKGQAAQVSGTGLRISFGYAVRCLLIIQTAMSNNQLNRCTYDLEFGKEDKDGDTNET